jgi:hypothetical protein
LEQKGGLACKIRKQKEKLHGGALSFWGGKLEI